MCGSWQRVSRNKSQVWFSPNTPLYLQHSICSTFQIPSTTNLKTYLGVPLIYSRTRTTHFSYILEKACQKLAGWKLKSLSRAARLVLIKSVLATLPLYCVQAIRLPQSIIQDLTKICQNVFWGSKEEHRSLHTVAWAKICRPRHIGGLGLVPLKIMTEALLAKMVWKLVQHQDKLSTRVLVAKYGGWSCLVRGIPRPGASIIWRSIQYAAR